MKAILTIKGLLSFFIPKAKLENELLISGANEGPRYVVSNDDGHLKVFLHNICTNIYTNFVCEAITERRRG